MGNSISWIWSKIFGIKKRRVLMVGLENAGKTTLLYRLKLGRVVQTSSTNCFNLESFEYENDIMEVWDIGGRWTIRTHFYPNTDALIFVIDGEDLQRMEDANLSILNTLRHEKMQIIDAPLLIFINKIDKCSKYQEIVSRIDIQGIRSLNPDIHMKIQPSSAFTGEGISEGIDWLCHSMKNSHLRTHKTLGIKSNNFKDEHV